MEEEPAFSGLAFAALKADSPEILIGSSAEEAIISCWRVLQLAVSWYRRVAPIGAELNCVVPESLADDSWAEEFSNFALVASLDFNNEIPDFPRERFEEVIVILLMQTNSVLHAIAERLDKSYSEVLDELHGGYLTYLASFNS